MTRYVEKAPHADADRIRHVTEAGLVAALDPDVVDIAAAGTGAEVDAFLAHLVTAGRRPVPALADVVAGYGADERARVEKAADTATAERRAFTDRGIGRSALYGFHYLLWTRPLLERYLLSGEERWLRRWEEIFLRWHGSRDDVRGDWPGLDVVWYTLGVGVRTPVLVTALDVGGTALGRDTRVRLLCSILGGARWLADEHDTFRPGNWQVVGACTLLCLGALFPEFTESAGWVSTGRARIGEHLDRDVHADGGHHERSPGYHRLCVDVLHQAALHAERYLDWSLGTDQRLVAMCDWLVAMATPEGWLPPFQDTAQVAAGPLLVVGHRWARRPEYKALATATMQASSIEQILAGLPARDGVPAERTWAESPTAEANELGTWLAGSRYFVGRSGRRPGSLYAAMNCGPHVPHELESHSHRACLDLVLWGHGRPLAWEAGGPDSYDDPDYHDWFQASRAHSTVLFAGRSPRIDDGATVDAVAFHPELDLIVAHHDGWGARHRRTLLAVRPSGPLPGYWLVHDEVAADGGWRWLLHGRSTWHRPGPATFVSTEAPGLLVHVTGTPEARTSVGRAAYPDPAGPYWGDLHALELAPCGRTLTALLVPFATTPPEVTTTEPDQGVLRVDWGDTTDEVGRRQWSRTGAGGSPTVRW